MNHPYLDSTLLELCIGQPNSKNGKSCIILEVGCHMTYKRTGKIDKTLPTLSSMQSIQNPPDHPVVRL